MACFAGEGVSYPAGWPGLQARPGAPGVPLVHDAPSLMPWNDNANPGPWGSPPPDDERTGRTQRPSGGGPRGPQRPGGGPDFDPFGELRKRLGSRFGRPGGGLRPTTLGAIVAGVFVIWALSGFYVVQPNEQAVVTTFGAYSRSEGSGLRYHLPAPIEQVQKVGVTDLKKTDVGGASSADSPQESLMLTADENIVNLNFSVGWKVADAARYVFATDDTEKAVKAVAESAMREVVGTTPLDAIMTTGRRAVEIRTADAMQRTLDAWGAGVSIVNVQIRSAGPPGEVVGAFRDVNNADQQAQSAVNEANAYRNKVVNEAKGTAAKVVQDAQAYREQSVRDALGDAARFNQILAEYRRAPGVTRQRLYLETMERVMASSNKVVVSGKATTAPVILPPDVFKPRTPAPEPQPPAGRAAQ